MKIRVASLTLRFYEKDGWTVEKIQKYLVNPKTKITYREGLKYFAVYGNSGHKVFKEKLLTENSFDNPLNADILWYIKCEGMR